MRTVPFNCTPLVAQRTLIWCLACCVNVLLAPAAAAQGGRLEIEYTVKVADVPGQPFHVTTDIKKINQPALELSLPVWTPGWYSLGICLTGCRRFLQRGHKEFRREF